MARIENVPWYIVLPLVQTFNLLVKLLTKMVDYKVIIENILYKVYDRKTKMLNIIKRKRKNLLDSKDWEENKDYVVSYFVIGNFIHLIVL